MREKKEREAWKGGRDEIYIRRERKRGKKRRGG